MEDIKLWASSILDQVDFYMKGRPIKRIDDTFTWNIVPNNPIVMIAREAAKAALKRIGRYNKKQPLDWFLNNQEKLWKSRLLFEDAKSRFAFDSVLILRICGYNRFFFPPTEFRQHLIEIKRKFFNSNELPTHYIGEQLYTFTCNVNGSGTSSIVNLIATECFIPFQNRYSQYLSSFEGVSFIPNLGDCVFDCGCCIGEVSIMIAGMVGKYGSVHLFDPVPLHIKFSQFQAELNPDLKDIFHYSQYAVNEKSFELPGFLDNINVISPGKRIANNFSSISLDDYCEKNNVLKLDYIKMDIEGSECNALKGSQNILKRFKPKLAISAYHLDDDFWMIPMLIKSLNPEYKLYFGHHSPVNYESVIYAA